MSMLASLLAPLDIERTHSSITHPTDSAPLPPNPDRSAYYSADPAHRPAATDSPAWRQTLDRYINHLIDLPHLLYAYGPTLRCSFRFESAIQPYVDGAILANLNTLRDLGQYR